jgi:excisionase family DNA binding protein
MLADTGLRDLRGSTLQTDRADLCAECGHDEKRQPTHRQATGTAVTGYTVEEVAEMLHIGRDKVYYLLRTGQLRSLKIGSLRRITDAYLAALVASVEDMPSA